MIAYGVGGARDIVIDGAGGTGVLFAEQSVESLRAAVDRFERDEAGISPARCRANALRFAEPAFRIAFRALVAAELGRKRQRRALDPHAADPLPTIPMDEREPVLHA